MSISVHDQVKELKRELRMRSGVYPRFVLEGRLNAAEADQRNARLMAAIATLEQLAPQEQEVLPL